MYDSRIGRWFNVDPMEQYFSAYLAMRNNPVSNIDPTGGYSKNDFDQYIFPKPHLNGGHNYQVYGGLDCPSYYINENGETRFVGSDEGYENPMAEINAWHASIYGGGAAGFTDASGEHFSSDELIAYQQLTEEYYHNAAILAKYGIVYSFNAITYVNAIRIGDSFTFSPLMTKIWKKL